MQRVTNCKNKMLIFIKPGDDEVFRNFITLLKYIELFEREKNTCMDVVLDNNLHTSLQKYRRENEEPDLTKEFNTIFSSEDKRLKSSIDWIITLGGDGTILWAAKNFNQGKCPPIITFS